MAFTATLVSSANARGGHRVVYTIGDGTTTYGPFVDQRPLADDVQAYIAGVASGFAAGLAATEIASNVQAVTTLGSQTAPTTKFSLAVDNFAALRATYATATQQQAVMIGDYLDTLSNAVLAVAFGITVGAAATLRANRLDPAAALATSIRGAVGQ